MPRQAKPKLEPVEIEPVVEIKPPRPTKKKDIIAKPVLDTKFKYCYWSNSCVNKDSCCGFCTVEGCDRRCKHDPTDCEYLTDLSLEERKKLQQIEKDKYVEKKSDEPKQVRKPRDTLKITTKDIITAKEKLKNKPKQKNKK